MEEKIVFLYVITFDKNIDNFMCITLNSSDSVKIYGYKKEIVEKYSFVLGHVPRRL